MIGVSGVGLAIGARDAALEMINDTDTGLALKRAAFYVCLLSPEAIKRGCILILRNARIPNATGGAADRS